VAPAFYAGAIDRNRIEHVGTLASKLRAINTSCEVVFDPVRYPDDDTVYVRGFRVRIALQGPCDGTARPESIPTMTTTTYASFYVEFVKGE
jgi:hypothetical protein